MRKVISLVLLWLMVINIFAFFVLNRFNFNADTAYVWINPSEFFQNKNLNLVNLRAHWDSFWYLKIAEQGYQYEAGKMSSIALFPLYPSLIWLISKLPLVSPVLAGWIISTIALFLGMIFFYKLIKQFHPNINPVEPVVLLLIFPTAFFLTSVYTESLFLTLSIIFFYYLLRKQFLMAAIFLSFTLLCRVNGLFLFIPFLYEYFKTYGVKKFINPNLASFLIALMGILSFMLYQYIQFGQPLAFLKSQMEWGRKFSLNPEYFQLVTPASYANFATDVLFLIVAIVSSLLLLRYIKVSYGLYVLAAVLIAVSTGTLMSIGRFTLILFPIFILIASFKNQQFKFSWSLLSTLLLAVYTILFVNNYWAG